MAAIINSDLTYYKASDAEDIIGTWNHAGTSWDFSGVASILFCVDAWGLSLATTLDTVAGTSVTEWDAGYLDDKVGQSGLYYYKIVYDTGKKEYTNTRRIEIRD